jgi:hypothetical protein
MPKGMGTKDPFEALPSEFKDAVAGSTPEEIRARIALTYRNEAENQRNLREDLHVAELKLRYDKLAEPYKTRKKTASVVASVAAQEDDHLGATEAAMELDQIEKDSADDNELISAKEEFADAKASYSEATAMNNLKIKFCLRVLSDKGKAGVGVEGDSGLRAAVEALKNIGGPETGLSITGPDGKTHVIKEAQKS